MRRVQPLNQSSTSPSHVSGRMRPVIGDVPRASVATLDLFRRTEEAPSWRQNITTVYSAGLGTNFHSERWGLLTTGNLELLFRVEQDGHRSVVHQRDFHHGLKLASLAGQSTVTHFVVSV